MNNLKVVTIFTMKEMLKRKSFIVTTIIILLLIILGFNIPNIINFFNKDSQTAENTELLIVDPNNIFEGSLDNLNSMNLGYNVKVSNENLTFDDIKSKIENEEIKEAIIVEKTSADTNLEGIVSENSSSTNVSSEGLDLGNTDNINNANNLENSDGIPNSLDENTGEMVTNGKSTCKLRYIVENMAMISTIPEDLLNAINTVYTNLQISKLGLTQEQLNSLTPNFEYSLEQTEEQEVSGNIMVIMLLSIVLFYAIYFCAYQVSSSITTEKTSKIMETLVTSTSPKTIVIGKTIGIGIVGLIQVCLFVAVALISAKLFLEPGILESVLDMSKFTPYLAIITILYFILGYFAYALLYALTGSTVSKPEDIQSANTPVAILAVVGFYLSYFTMMNPTSDLNVFASMFPISSPFCMPFRIMMGIASTIDVIISIAILVVTILIVANVAIKIYSNAILNYGTRMTFKDMVKIYRDKNS